jgi:hypothetical protein
LVNGLHISVRGKSERARTICEAVDHCREARIHLERWREAVLALKCPPYLEHNLCERRVR